MNLETWTLAALLHLAPWMTAQEARLVDIADAIAQAADTREEAAELASLAWWESGRSLEDRVGDGGHSVSLWQLWVCPGPRCAGASSSVAYAAREALVEVRRSKRACARQAPENRLSQYTTGKCQTNREARMRYATAHRLLREVDGDGARVALSGAEARTMSEMMRIVCWDPADEYWEGSLVADTAEAAIKLRGGVLLPVEPVYFRQSGIGGFFRRSWGAGWPLDHLTPKPACPITLYVPQEHRVMHWRLRLVPDARFMGAAKEGRAFTEGQVMIIPESSRCGGHKAGLTPERGPVTARELGKVDDFDGWTVEGRARLHPPADAFYEFVVYGTMPGVRVAWAAASTTSR